MYLCMYICPYGCNVCIYVSICIYQCIYIYVHMDLMYVSMYLYISVYVYISIWIWCMYLCIYIYISVCVYVPMGLMYVSMYLSMFYGYMYMDGLMNVFFKLFIIAQSCPVIIIFQCHRYQSTLSRRLRLRRPTSISSISLTLSLLRFFSCITPLATPFPFSYILSINNVSSHISKCFFYGTRDLLL